MNRLLQEKQRHKFEKKGVWFKFIVLFPPPGNAFRKVGNLEESLAFAKEVSATQDALSHQQRQLIAFLSKQSSESLTSRKCSQRKK